MLDDSKSDIERLYNALAKNNLITARMVHKHLRTLHGLDKKEVRNRLETLTKSKIVKAYESIRNGTFNGNVQVTQLGLSVSGNGKKRGV